MSILANISDIYHNTNRLKIKKFDKSYDIYNTRITDDYIVFGTDGNTATFRVPPELEKQKNDRESMVLVIRTIDNKKYLYVLKLLESVDMENIDKYLDDDVVSYLKNLNLKDITKLDIDHLETIPDGPRKEPQNLLKQAPAQNTNSSPLGNKEELSLKQAPAQEPDIEVEDLTGGKKKRKNSKTRKYNKKRKTMKR